jgi:hypothetical protein
MPMALSSHPQTSGGSKTSEDSKTSEGSKTREDSKTSEGSKTREDSKTSEGSKTREGNAATDCRRAGALFPSSRVAKPPVCFELCLIPWYTPGPEVSIRFVCNSDSKKKAHE